METIANFLKDKIDIPITIGSLIDGNGVGLFSTSGLEPTFYFDDEVPLEYNGLQIISRNESYSKGEKIINDIFSIMNSLEGYKPQQSPFHIGKDDKGRSEFSVNYIIMKEGT
ncbi:hypothetical protein SDC9_72735 [bioreactor metagenome]|uniref:Uncharacterized protein n=1 Tax=bioreactor metagenome TaxID=1076179 RepID=A0A644YJD7_9ZZZZ